MSLPVKRAVYCYIGLRYLVIGSTYQFRSGSIYVLQAKVFCFFLTHFVPETLYVTPTTIIVGFDGYAFRQSPSLTQHSFKLPFQHDG